MRKITAAIILAGLLFVSPAAAKAAIHHHRSRPVHHRKHPVHHRKHRHRGRQQASAAGRPGPVNVPVRPAPEAPPVTRSNGPTPISPQSPVRMIGIGNAPGCLNGADPTPYIRTYAATVLRIVLSQYGGAPGTHGEAIPCLKAATAAGARVEIGIQWRSVWTPAQAADFVRQQLAFYAPYAWAVGLGNEQDLDWGLPGQPIDAPQTADQYAADFQAAAQVVATAAPRAVRVAVEGSPWSLPFSQQALADGLPGAQALAFHAYGVEAATIRDFYNLATSYGMPLWCTEGLDGPGVWVDPRYPPESSAQLADCQLAVAWLN